ncbi:MAG: hypothetical protein A4S09_10270 [Proteobacteria bacterium SG_bin7]|nr:MAG: hypothetical protein A4S09_10270 [Proteobacteria bacterium SG_bin7]
MKRVKKRERLISSIDGSKRWAVFISGQGSNFRALSQSPHLAKIVLVLSSSINSPGILFARRYGIPCKILEKPIDWKFVHSILLEDHVDSIFLLGFMRILPSEFVNLWEKRMLNLHPSLLPDYPGLKSIERAFEARDNIGVTVHEVTAEMDAGPIVLQRIAVDKESVQRFNLSDVEFMTHVREQELICEGIFRWTSVKI